jgi:hypothetical protein
MAFDPFVDSIFVQLTDHDSNDGELPDRSSIPERHRTLILVYHCQGLIGNGGFHFLLEGDFNGDPGYQLTKQAFRNIGASGALIAWNRMESIFPESRIPLNIDHRLAIWKSKYSRFDDDTPDTTYFAAMDETSACLLRYIDRHFADFEPFAEKGEG